MKLSLYFLFYVAMVLELLIFIVDRDDAEERVAMATKTMLQQLSSVDEVKVFGTKAFKLGEEDSVELGYHTFTLISDSERTSVLYQIKRTYTYNDAILAEFTDVTLPSGMEIAKTEEVTAAVRGVAKRALVTVKLSRDPKTGGAVVKLRHDLPRQQNGRPDAYGAFREGEVTVEVLPVLKRSFPLAFKSNPQVLQFMKDQWKIDDVNNFWPRCIPATTRIEFRPTSNIRTGSGLQ